jgi:hypothetical protein
LQASANPWKGEKVSHTALLPLQVKLTGSWQAASKVGHTSAIFAEVGVSGNASRNRTTTKRKRIRALFIDFSYLLSGLTKRLRKLAVTSEMPVSIMAELLMSIFYAPTVK